MGALVHWSGLSFFQDHCRLSWSGEPPGARPCHPGSRSFVNAVSCVGVSVVFPRSPKLGAVCELYQTSPGVMSARRSRRSSPPGCCSWSLRPPSGRSGAAIELHSSQKAELLNRVVRFPPANIETDTWSSGKACHIWRRSSKQSPPNSPGNADAMFPRAASAGIGVRRPLEIH